MLKHVSQNKSIMEDLDAGQLRELTFGDKKGIWTRAFLSEIVYVTLHCKVFNPLMHDVNNKPFLNIHGMMLHPNHVWQPLTLSHNYTCLSIVLFITAYNSIIQNDWQKWSKITCTSLYFSVVQNLRNLLFCNYSCIFYIVYLRLINIHPL